MKTRRPQHKDETELDLDVDKSARVLSAELPIEAELLYIGGLGVVLFLLGLVLDWQFLRIVSKPWPVVAVARWVLFVARERKRPELRTVAHALIAGATGDLFLELGEATFLLGVAAFLVGHLFYIQALHRETVALHPLRALPGLAFVGAVVGVLTTRLPPELLVAFSVYGLAVAGLVFRAAARVDSPKVDKDWARFGLFGAALFAVSDGVIAIDRFHTEITGASYIIIATYWAAQALLAVSLVRAEKPVLAVKEEPMPAAYTAASEARAEGTDAPASPPEAAHVPAEPPGPPEDETG